MRQITNKNWSHYITLHYITLLKWLVQNSEYFLSSHHLYQLYVCSNYLQINRPGSLFVLWLKLTRGLSGDNFVLISGHYWIILTPNFTASKYNKCKQKKNYLHTFFPWPTLWSRLISPCWINNPLFCAEVASVACYVAVFELVRFC